MAFRTTIIVKLMRNIFGCLSDGRTYAPPSFTSGWPGGYPCPHRSARGARPCWSIQRPSVPSAWDPVCHTHCGGVDHSPHPHGLGHGPPAGTAHGSIGEVYVCMCVYVCVCVYICMHLCMSVCMYICMYIYKYMRIFVCMCVFTYVCICVCLYVCIYVCIYINICVFLCVCVCLHMYASVYVCMYVYMYVYI